MQLSGNFKMQRVRQFFTDLNPRRKAKQTKQMQEIMSEQGQTLGVNPYEEIVIFDEARKAGHQHEYCQNKTIQGMEPRAWMKKNCMDRWVREGLATPPPGFSFATSSRQADNETLESRPNPAPRTNPPQYVAEGGPEFNSEDRILETPAGVIVMGRNTRTTATNIVDLEVDGQGNSVINSAELAYLLDRANRTDLAERPGFLDNEQESNKASRAFIQLHSEHVERQKMLKCINVLEQELGNVRTNKSSLKRAIDKHKISITRAQGNIVPPPHHERDIALSPILEEHGSLGLIANGERLPQDWTLANFREALVAYRVRHQEYDKLLRDAIGVTDEIMNIAPKFHSMISQPGE